MREISPLQQERKNYQPKLAGALANGMTATTQSQNDNSTKIATTAYVDTAIENLPEPMVFKGTLGTGGTITTLPAAAVGNTGWTYKVITAGTYQSIAAKVGDTFISTGTKWELIPSGDEPSGTVTSVGIANATNGGMTVSNSPITSSGTISIGHSNVLSTAQTTQGVYQIKWDKNGHITGASSTPVTILAKKVLTVTGDGSTTEFALSHGLNTKDVIVQVYDIDSDEAVVTDIETTSTSSVTIAFGSAPVTGKKYKVVIIG